MGLALLFISEKIFLILMEIEEKKLYISKKNVLLFLTSGGPLLEHALK